MSSSLKPKSFEEEEPNQECREKISTMPHVTDWAGGYLHFYQGFWVTTRHLQGLLSCQKHFEAHDTDIFLVTPPKSGTTWLKALVFALVNRNKYQDMQNHPLLTSNPHPLVPFLEFKLYAEKDHLPDLTSFSSPRLFASHISYVSLPKSIKESTCKIVYLCRDPKDTFVSLWHFIKKLAPQGTETNSSLEECFDKFCRGESNWGPLWEHILGYWKESMERPEKIKFLRFEEMKMRPSLVLKELAEFLGCPFSKEEECAGMPDEIIKLCSFEKLSNLEVNKSGRVGVRYENKFFFRRGEVGDSKNFLTTEMIEQLNAITENKLAQQGLRF